MNDQKSADKGLSPLGRAAYTTAEVGELLGLSEGYTRELINRGLLEAFKTRPGSRAPWRVTPEAVNKYILARTQEGRS